MGLPQQERSRPADGLELELQLFPELPAPSLPHQTVDSPDLHGPGAKSLK